MARWGLAAQSQVQVRGPLQDLVHFRDGLDPQNPRKGRSKVKLLLREIYTDEQAARWTASLLRNQAVPGLIVSPQLPLANDADAEEVNLRLQMQFSGDRVGAPIVLKGPANVHQYSFSPEQMKLGDLRDIPEERVSAVTGVPAAVVGFGTGLQMTKVGRTLEEMVDLAWQNAVLPRSRVLAAELSEQLLPEFEAGAVDEVEFAFDTSAVPIMADYWLKVAQKHELLVRAGIERRGEARRAVGLEAGARDDVYLLNADAAEVPASKALPNAPAAAGGGNGDGADEADLEETEPVA